MVAVIPAVGSRWLHKGGSEYEVLTVANLDGDSAEYPVTVVYRDMQGRVWSRLLSSWHGFATLAVTAVDVLEVEELAMDLFAEASDFEDEPWLFQSSAVRAHWYRKAAEQLGVKGYNGHE